MVSGDFYWIGENDTVSLLLLLQIAPGMVYRSVHEHNGHFNPYMK